MSTPLKICFFGVICLVGNRELRHTPKERLGHIFLSVSFVPSSKMGSLRPYPRSSSEDSPSSVWMDPSPQSFLKYLLPVHGIWSFNLEGNRRPFPSRRYDLPVVLFPSLVSTYFRDLTFPSSLSTRSRNLRNSSSNDERTRDPSVTSKVSSWTQDSPH